MGLNAVGYIPLIQKQSLTMIHAVPLTMLTIKVKLSLHLHCMEDSTGNYQASTESSGNIEDAAVESFTSEEEILYTTRYNEGYNEGYNCCRTLRSYYNQLTCQSLISN